VTYVITPGCCNDASCIAVCPVQCIRPRPGDPDFLSTEQLYIDPATCIDCQACMDECPIDAVHTEYDMPDEFGDLLALNAAYFDTHPILDDSPIRQVQHSLPAERPHLRVAVVGSGPAACYAVESLSEVAGVEVSVVERLPTPFGLVRAGVAPDHGKTKLMANAFDRVLRRDNVACFFNVEIGVHLSIDELLEHHHAEIWAAGAADDRKLGLPGEDLPGSHSAREFVAWYNGHPDHATDRFDLSGQTVVLIGNGNVALDVARALTRPVEELEPTDIADHALEALRESNVTEVVIVARRGPEHAAYSTGELAALTRLRGVDVVAQADDIAHPLDTSDTRHAILSDAVRRQPTEGNRRIVFRYQLSPIEIEGDDRARAVTFAGPDGQTETIKTSLVLRAVGYRGRAHTGLPFDEATGTIPHANGRIVDTANGSVPGLYCAGWIKRGATGVIGTNRTDAGETVASLLEDFVAGELPDPPGGADALSALVHHRQPQLVDAGSWRRIDDTERALGRELNRTRLKLVTVEELVAASRGHVVSRVR
jgi:ferredoxin/flavodoxin---NADP+ reductase